MIIRQADTSHCERLNRIAVNSEAFWGYDSDFMESFKALYNIREEFIRDNETYVIEENESIIGFYSILMDNKEASLEYFYIEPKYIGKGYGRTLWNHLVNKCRNNNINEIVLVTSPQAKDFYIKMGAVQTGEVESIVMEGRKIPKLVYSFKSS